MCVYVCIKAQKAMHQTSSNKHVVRALPFDIEVKRMNIFHRYA